MWKLLVFMQLQIVIRLKQYNTNSWIKVKLLYIMTETYCRNRWIDKLRELPDESAGDKYKILRIKIQSAKITQTKQKPGFTWMKRVLLNRYIVQNIQERLNISDSFEKIDQKSLCLFCLNERCENGHFVKMWTIFHKTKYKYWKMDFVVLK